MEWVVFWWPGADIEHKYADDRTEYTGSGMKCSPRVGVDTSLVIHQPIVFHFNGDIIESAGDTEND